MVLFTGCGQRTAQEEGGTGQIVMEDLKQRDTDISAALSYTGSMEIHYAKRFAVDYYEGGYTLLTAADGKRILVIPEGLNLPEGLEEDIVVLKRPVEKIYLAATAVMDMFRELHAIDRVRFSGQKQEGWYIGEAADAMAEGRMLYAGKYSMPDYELIVSEGCGLAIENTMITHAPEVTEKLEGFGIPVLIDYSSYEEHPLGRVEWIRFYGALLGKEEAAAAAFDAQEEILNTVLQEEPTGKTVAFFYITTNGTVQVKKPSDYIPQMIELAGGQYFWKEEGDASDHRSSVNLQMEEFYAMAKETDYLIYNSTIDGEVRTIEELLAKDEILKNFTAVQEGRVWCTTGELYQQSMSVGGFIRDIHTVLSGNPDHELQYLFLLEDGGTES